MKWTTEKTSIATVLGVCILSILVIYWTAEDTESFLGQGATSTVWLARDLSFHKYVAVKIKESDLSNLLNEVSILNHLSGASSDHPGRIYSAASLLQRHFWIDGPNDRHLALVCQVLGPGISRLNYWQIRLESHLARNIALQVTQGLEYCK